MFNFNIFIPILALSLPCVVLGFFIGVMVYKNNGDETMKQQAIENSCAQYNPTTGQFEWLKK